VLRCAHRSGAARRFAKLVGIVGAIIALAVVIGLGSARYEG
jgi:hypothetical protein